MNVLYVTSNQRGAGKTAFCATLAHQMVEDGRRAAVWKPIGGANDADAAIYRHLLGQADGGGPREAPKGGLTPALIEDIKKTAGEAGEGQDVLLVEGSPDLSAEDSQQLAEALDAKVVVVARFDAGLEAAGLSEWGAPFGDRLLGYVVNGLTRYRGKYVSSRLVPSMESQGMTALGVIPEERTLLGVSVGQLTAHLDGRYLVGEEMSDSLVEHFLVGIRGMDAGLEYYSLHDRKAVIVPGDRPDVHMSVLQTPTACLLVTKGLEPIEYVINEAELEQVPVVLVESDTLTTMAALNTIQQSARFDHPAKLERYSELLDRHVDTAAIRAGLGLAA
jgi:BioD-like phosphotransacetylase family protein